MVQTNPNPYKAGPSFSGAGSLNNQGASSDFTDKPGFPKWAIYAIAIGLVLILVIVSLAFFLNNGEDKSGPVSNEGSGSSSGSSGSEGFDTLRNVVVEPDSKKCESDSECIEFYNSSEYFCHSDLGVCAYLETFSCVKDDDCDVIANLSSGGRVFCDNSSGLCVVEKTISSISSDSSNESSNDSSSESEVPEFWTYFKEG